MSEALKTGNSMEMELLTIPLEISMRANLKMGNLMEKACTILQTEQNMSEALKTGNPMEMELLTIPPGQYDILEDLKMAGSHR